MRRGPGSYTRAGDENEWNTRNVWGEDIHRSSGCGPSDRLCRSGACAGGYDRGCVGAGLSEQSAAQRTTRLGAVHRRKRAAGALRLSPQGRAHGVRRLSVYRHQPDVRRFADRDRANRSPRRQCTARRRPDGYADLVQRQSDRQQDPRGGEPGLGCARGAACAR